MSHYETNSFLKNISLNVFAIISIALILMTAAILAIDSEDTVNTVCAVEDAEEEKFQEENVDEINLNYDPPCKEEAKEGEAEVVADEGFKILFFIIFVIAPGLIFMVYLLLDNSDFFSALFAEPSNADFILDISHTFFYKKKIGKRKLRKLFDFQKTSGSGFTDNAIFYKPSSSKMYDLLTITLNDGEDQLYQILTCCAEYYTVYTAISVAIKYALEITKYLYNQVPCYLNDKNDSSDVLFVRKRLLTVLLVYIERTLSKEEPEWLNEHQKAIENTIRNSNLPLQVEGLDVWIDYSSMTPETIYSFSDLAITKDLDRGLDQTKTEVADAVSEDHKKMLERIVSEIAKTIEYLEDDDIKRQMETSQKLLVRINNAITNGEVSEEASRKLMEFYLPVYEKFLRTYCSVQDQYGDMKVNNAKQLLKDIEISVPLINKILDECLNQSLQKTVWDIQSDISVLKTIAKQDGYV